MPEIIKKHRYALIIILCALLLRFWQIPERFIFDIDVQYQSLFAWTVVKDFHVLWIGVSAGSTGFYLGPGLVYLTAVLLKLTNGDPVILGYFASTIGALTVISMYYIAQDLFNKKMALIATVLYGFSTFVILYDRKFWPLAVPLIAIWLYYSLVKSRTKTWWLALSLILMGLAYHVHLSLLLFWPLIIFAILNRRNDIKITHIIVGLGSFLLVLSPLIVYDFLSNFSNLLTPVRMIQEGQGSGLSISNGVEYLERLVENSIHFGQGSTIFARVAFWSIVIIYSWVILNKYIFTKIHGIKETIYNVPTRQSYLLSIILLFVIAVLLYPGTLQEYYGVFLIPFLFLFIATQLNKMPKNYLLSIMTIYILANSYIFFSQSSEYGLQAKKQFIQKTSAKIDSNQYRLQFEPTYDYQGWRYLFQAYGKRPAQSTADAQFGWLYQDDIKEDEPVLTVHVTTKDRIKKPYQAVVEHGAFKAYIIEE